MDFGLSDTAKKQFDDLYSLPGETIKDTFERVAKEFAKNDDDYKYAYDFLADGIWRPNTPTFLNAGTSHKIFSACFVAGLQDSMESIYDIADTSRKIFQFGSGIGIPIGNLREAESGIFEGDDSQPPVGKSSGPIVFMRLYDTVGDTTKSGGRVRRAAILCNMPVWHPNILDFISCKEQDGRLKNMNISVNVTDEFMNAVNDGITFDLRSPRRGEKKGEIDAREVWNRIADMAWKSADPGVIFVDRMNEFNPLVKSYLIECTNPCIVGDTKIMTDRGEIRIDEMNINDKVLTYNTETNELEFEDISFVGKTKENVDIIEVEVDDGEILRLTPDHKVFTENRGYVIASDLLENDVLLSI